MHLEGHKGTTLEASDYCKKEDENPIIHGNNISQLMFDPEHMQVVPRNIQYFLSAWNTILSTKTMNDLREIYSTAVFRPWQENLITYLNDPVHPRQVLWYYDEADNTGKSWMTI